MMGVIDRAWGLFRRQRPFDEMKPLVLINGLAEQSATWFRNRRSWEWDFDVKVPELLIYDGQVLHRRIAENLPISIDYLTDQLDAYLDAFVQNPPYHLVASSLGGQVAVEYALRHPDKVARMVLICPSGFGGEEKLPVIEGVRHSDHQAMLASIFYHPRRINPGLCRYYQRQFANRQWKKGILRTVKGTCGHSVREKLPKVHQPTLLILGREDRIVDTPLALEAVRGLANFRTVLVPRCGHAPQIEQPRLVNRLVRGFLMGQQPDAVRTAPEPAPVVSGQVQVV